MRERAAAVTRIARRRALPGHEHAYEELVREMFARMRRHPGFCGADLIPPTEPGGDYQVVVHFASEEDLAGWDASADRREMLDRMRGHAEGDVPEHRRLSVLDEWFGPPEAPAAPAGPGAGGKPPRWRVGLVTWLGIWPLASFFIFALAPVLTRAGLPFLAVTAVNTILIVACMTWVVAPLLTRLLHGFLHPRR